MSTGITKEQLDEALAEQRKQILEEVGVDLEGELPKVFRALFEQELVLLGTGKHPSLPDQKAYLMTDNERLAIGAIASLSVAIAAYSAGLLDKTASYSTLSFDERVKRSSVCYGLRDAMLYTLKELVDTINFDDQTGIDAYMNAIKDLGLKIPDLPKPEETK